MPFNVGSDPFWKSGFICDGVLAGRQGWRKAGTMVARTTDMVHRARFYFSFIMSSTTQDNAYHYLIYKLRLLMAVDVRILEHIR